jgi:hypothetical protein
MADWTQYKDTDWAKADWTKIDLTTVDWSKVEWLQIDWSKKTDKEIHAVVEVLYKRVVARYNDFKKILSQIKQGALTSAEIRNWKLIYTEEHDALIKPLLDLRLKRPPYSYGTGIGDKQVAEWIDDAEKKFNEISKISSA